MQKALLSLGLAVCLSAAALPVWAGPALVFDPEKGTVLYSEDPDTQWHPASLTKLMTAYVVFDAIKQGKLRPEDKIACSQHALEQAPSKLGLPVGAELTVDTALKVLIVKSANDVAVMLAEAVSGSEEAFVDRMNEAAGHLGMSRTRFVNANGLPDDRQVTTARDLGKLARAILTDFPENTPVFAMTEVAVGKRRMGTHNGLLRSFQGADGMKTGFICDSGYNVVASATRNGRKVVAVVLGERSGAARTIRASQLMEHGFQRYFWKSMFGPNIDRMAVEASLAQTVPTLRGDICGGGRTRVRGRIKLKTTPMTASTGNAAILGVGTAEEDGDIALPTMKPATTPPDIALPAKKPAAKKAASRAGAKRKSNAEAGPAAPRKPQLRTSIN